MLSLITRCYYEFTKFHLDRPHPKLNLASLILDYATYFFTGIKFLYISYLITINYQTTYQFKRYDPFITVFYQLNESIDAFLPIVIVIMGTYHLACSTELYLLKPQEPIWRWWRQLIVEHQDMYYGCLLSTEEVTFLRQRKVQILLAEMATKQGGLLQWVVPEFATQWYCRVKANYSIWNNLENINREQFFTQKLSIMPNLSRKLRSRIILICLVVEKVTFGLHISIAIMTLFFLAFFLGPSFYTAFTWYSYLWFAIDLYCLLHHIVGILRQAHFFICCCILVIPAYAWHVDECADGIARAIAKYRRRRWRVPISSRQLNYFLIEHSKACHLFVEGSRAIFANIEFYFLLINLPFNIYIIKRFVFDDQLPFIQIVLGMVFAIQSSAFYISLRPLAYVCKRLHEPRVVLLPALQQCLWGQRALLYKLKFDDLLKRLGRGPKYAITIGPTREVTHETIMEVGGGGKGEETIMLFIQIIGIYVGYLLMVFSMAIEAQLGVQEEEEKMAL